jgi:hypothetical protein
MLPPLGPGHHHVDPTAAAPGTDQALTPIEHGHSGAVTSSHLGGRRDGRAGAKSACGLGHDLLDRDRLAQTLQGEIADLIECDCRFDRGGDAVAQQDLALTARVAGRRCGFTRTSLSGASCCTFCPTGFIASATDPVKLHGYLLASDNTILNTIP